MFRAPTNLLRYKRVEKIMRSAVEPLALVITLGVIRGCPTLFDGKELAKFGDEVALKITALVGVKSLRDSIPHEPLAY